MRAVTLILFVTATTAWAGEYAVLATGFRIHASSHVIEDGTVRLQTEQGAIEMPASAVASFETEEYTPPPPAVPVANEVPAQPPQTVGSQPVDPKELLNRAALLAGLPPALVQSVARAESAYQTGAISPKGAVGLMQLMPGTAAALNADPYDPRQNAEAGALYLRDLLVRYQNDPHQVTKAIAAYNAGPGAVDRYHGVPPYRETVQYVNRVVKQYIKNQELSQ